MLIKGCLIRRTTSKTQVDKDSTLEVEGDVPGEEGLGEINRMEGGGISRSLQEVISPRGRGGEGNRPVIGVTQVLGGSRLQDREGV